MRSRGEQNLAHPEYEPKILPCRAKRQYLLNLQADTAF